MDVHDRQTRIVRVAVHRPRQVAVRLSSGDQMAGTRRSKEKRVRRGLRSAASPDHAPTDEHDTEPDEGHRQQVGVEEERLP
jgi:hypothetical protein